MEGNSLIECKIHTCQYAATRRGMCNAHYRRMLIYGDAFADRKIKRPLSPCSVPGCRGPNMARGLCSTHRYRNIHHGSPRSDIPIGGFSHLGRQAKKVRRAIRKPTIHEVYWAAGFLDGEGSFGISPPPRQSQRVTGTQKSPELLIKLQEIFGGHIAPNKTHIHHWMVSGSRARGIMMTLYPLLSTKRQREIKRALFA